MTRSAAAAIVDGRARLHERADHNDYEAAAALVVLEFLNDMRAWRHVDTDGIHWTAILRDGTWSSGERQLLQLGQALWKGNGPVDVAYLFTCLSDSYLHCVVDAITARRGYVPLPAPFPRDGAL